MFPPLEPITERILSVNDPKRCIAFLRSIRPKFLMFLNYFFSVGDIRALTSYFFKRPDLRGAECSCWGRKNLPTDWYHPPVLRLPTPLSSNPFPLRSLSTLTPIGGLQLSPNPHADSGDTNRTTKKGLQFGCPLTDESS